MFRQAFLNYAGSHNLRSSNKMGSSSNAKLDENRQNDTAGWPLCLAVCISITVCKLKILLTKVDQVLESAFFLFE